MDISIWQTMNIEKKKITGFFDKFANSGVNKPLSWMGAGICVLVMVPLCLIPAQEIYMDVEDAPDLIPGWVSILGALAGYFRILFYEVYSENQKSKAVSELLQYHPIDQKKIVKMKFYYLARFIFKIAGICLLAQLGMTFWEYGTVSWINVGYILLHVGIFPVLWFILYNSINFYVKKQD